MGRNIVAVESEKRKFEAKLKKQMSSKYWQVSCFRQAGALA